MSLQGMLRRKVGKRYQLRRKILAPKSDKRLNRVGCVWIALAYAVAFVTNALDLHFSDCAICESIGVLVPSIEINSSGSRHPEEMTYVWFYVVLTAPVLFVALLLFVRDFNQRVLPTWGVIFLLVFVLIGIYTFAVGISFGGEDSSARLSRLYHKYLFCSVLYACSIGAAFAISTFHLVHHIAGAMKKESPATQETTND